MVLKNKGRSRGDKRSARPSLFGNPIEDREVAVSTKDATKTAVKALTKAATNGKASSGPKYSPVSDEITPYGAKKFRTPYTKDEFAGYRGSPQTAVILDIDGTLQSWGSSTDKKVMEFAKKHYEAGDVLLVITARDHGTFGYESSFNWLMHNLPYPFIGPFARAKSDPRYASEFKREIAQGFEDMGLFKIVGAADDNDYVNDMWKHWAKTHFADPADFDLLEVPTYSYQSWRNDLPSKGSGYTYSGSSSYYNSHKDEHWNPELKAYERDDAKPGYHWALSRWDPKTKVSIPGHWEPDTDAKHRAAGSSRWEKNDGEVSAGGEPVDISADPRWAHYVAQRYGRPVQKRLAGSGEPDWPTGGLNVISESPNGSSEQTRAEIDAEIVEIVEELAREGQGHNPYSVDREDLEAIVAHDYPGYTPEELDQMGDEELRELAGITATDYRDDLYGRIHDRYSGRYTNDELDNATTAELEKVLAMSDAEADAFFDDLWAQFGPDVEDKGAYRQDLEGEVYAAYDDMSWADIDAKSDTELELLLDHAEALRENAEYVQLDTAALDVAEVLGEFADEEPERASARLADVGDVVRQAQQGVA